MAVNRYKVLMVEVNGTDLADQEELALDASNVYVNVPGLSDDVNTALSQLYANPGHFSYNDVNLAVTVPSNQQMVVYQEMLVSNGFEIEVQGEVVIIV